MFDEQLASSVKQLGQRHLAFRRIKDVFLVDLHPRQRATLRGQLIAQACEFLFPFEQILARDQPLSPRDNFVLRKRSVSSDAIVCVLIFSFRLH